MTSTLIITFIVSAMAAWLASGLIGILIGRRTWRKYYDAEDHRQRYYSTFIMLCSGPFTIRHSLDVNKISDMLDSQAMQRAEDARNSGSKVTYRIWNGIKDEHLDMFHQKLEFNTPEVARMYFKKAMNTNSFHRNELRIQEYIDDQFNRTLDKK